MLSAVGKDLRVSRIPDHLDGGPVLLQKRSVADVSAFVEAMRSSWTELAECFPWAQQPLDVEEQTGRALASAKAFDSDSDYEFVVIERTTDAIVGSLRLDPDGEPGAAGIGYWVRTDRTGRGYATAAAKAATRAAFEHLSHIDRVLINMDVAYRKSAAVPRKLGYVLEGEAELPIKAPGRTGRGLFWVMTRDRWSLDQ